MSITTGYKKLLEVISLVILSSILNVDFSDKVIRKFLYLVTESASNKLVTQLKMFRRG